jgi:hypothetical protein
MDFEVFGTAIADEEFGQHVAAARGARIATASLKTLPL